MNVYQEISPSHKRILLFGAMLYAWAFILGVVLIHASA
jgi:hypothetical protein